MAPTSQNVEPIQNGQVPYHLDGNSVVISGISGIYANSKNLKDLSDVLYNKTNPIIDSKPRFDYSHPELPPYTGFAPDLEYFDAQFFKIHYRQAIVMDVMNRKILEQTYQALFDAGFSTKSISGKKVGVYIGACFSESDKTCYYDKTSNTGFGVTGCSKAMYANRVSYWLNVKGPSLVMDSSCCSSITCLETAVNDIKKGECEAAIVGGIQLCLHPQSSVNYGRVITLCQDGKTKSFDQNCDGCARAEGINVLFLQKAKDARRIYAHVVHSKSEFTAFKKDEKGIEYGFNRNLNDVTNFMEKFYEEVGISPEIIDYVEGFGSANPDADKTELEAIEKVFCKNRRQPLPVGSITSNIGYTEAASGIASITKIALANQRGELAANLNCSQPRQDIAALRDNRMRIVTEHEPFRRSFVAINSFSLTGMNAHVLLHGFTKPKELDRYKSSIPRLVMISGRQESAVKIILDDLKSKPIDAEQIGLLHKIHEDSQPGHMSRGYTILDTKDNNDTVCLAERLDYFDNENRPLWFVYSGMGSQWTGMGTHLMRIPVFAAAIERCHKVLAPKGINIVDIITSEDKTTFDNILNSFVGIAAIQIGLTDVLREVGIVPDKIIGHSVGELGCGYADGCFTAEEMILSAYSRGLVSVQTPFIRGSMAAVGIGYQQVVKLCPPEIEVACHNGPESSTISGPAEIMKEFVANLKSQGIFAKEVPCSNIAYHSRYIAEAGPKLLEYLSEVIKSPKRRTDRWLSTSVPQDRWNETNSQYCSAWYHTNNLLSQVLFEETSQLVPSNAILIEVAPHGLLQAILKRSLSADCRHIPLTKRGHPDNVLYLLEALGKLYLEGFNPKIQQLYPKIEFPVSASTPILSNLVLWSHIEEWYLPLMIPAERKGAAICNHLVSIHDDEHSYLKGNVFQGKMHYPFAAALVAVWDTLAMSLGVVRKSIPIEFRDLHLYSAPLLHQHKQLTLTVTFHWGTGEFEVMNGPSKVITGVISHENLSQPTITNDDNENENQTLDIGSAVIYKLLKDRDYAYSDAFCAIHKSNHSFTKAQIKWNDNWVTFIDAILQLNVLRHKHNNVSQPSHIYKLFIDVQKHLNILKKEAKSEILLDAHLSPLQSYTRCGGVYLSKLELYDIPSLTLNAIKIKSKTFIPYHIETNDNLDATEMYDVYLQMVSEYLNRNTIKVVEISNDNKNIAEGVDISEATLRNNVIYKKLNQSFVEKFMHKNLDADVVLCDNVRVDKWMSHLLPGTWIINKREAGGKNNLSPDLFKVVGRAAFKKSVLELGLWKTQKQPFNASVIVRTESDFSKLVAIRNAVLNNNKLLVVTSYPPLDSLKALISSWRNESNRNKVYLASVTGDVSLDLPWKSLDLELPYNILKDGIWGGEYNVDWQENIAYVRGMKLCSEQIGDIDSLKFVEMPELTKSGITVTVRYAGINDFDVKKASGIIPIKKGGSNSYGMDYSGTTDRAERVMGIVPGGAVSGRVVAVPELMWPVPKNWTLEDAATVPLAYVQAFYCLGIKATLHPTMSILIHGGAGALGQAAISIALAHHCEVFTTVSTVQKKQFLRKLFPQLKEDHIGNSRNSSFGDMVLQLTNGKGCEITISCVKNKLKNTSLSCASFSGITIDTVGAYSEDNYLYGMNYMTRQRSYAMVDFAKIFDYPEDMKAIQLMVSKGITEGYVKPLTRVTYAAKDVSRAFRFMAASFHRGRVLLRLQDAIISARPIITCSETQSHLIFSDSETLGLGLVDRLVSRGAKRLHLHCLAGSSDYLRYRVSVWQSQDIKVETTTGNLQYDNIINLIKKCGTLIEDVYVIISKDTINMGRLVTDLDKATRENCSSLKFFTLLNLKDLTGEQVCVNRLHDNLPSVMLNLTGFNEDLKTWRKALDAMEQTLNSNQTILQIQNELKPKTSLLQQIATKADLKISDSQEKSTTLNSLGLDSSKAQIIAAYLRNTQDLYLEQDKIPHLTVQMVNELEEMVTEPDFTDVKGFKNFFSYIDSDELLATTSVVFLPNLVKTMNMRRDEIDTNKTYMIIVPGLEGHHERFRTLCSRLKISALVLQPGGDRTKETVQETAKRYTQILKKKIQIKNNFYILGYESGVKVALEMASNLESEGMTGKVFCVGGTPEDMEDKAAKELFDFDSEEQLQNAFMSYMGELMASGASKELQEKLKGDSTWQEKLETCVNTLTGRVTYSNQYTRLMIDGTYSRMQELLYNKLRPRQLKSKIIVLRALTNFTTEPQEIETYSHQPVTNYYLQTPLVHVAKDPECAAIVNRHLDDEILKEFWSKNLCENYLRSADTIIAKKN